MANLGILNQNPGNLKDPKTGGFVKFSSPEEGYQALVNDLKIKQSGRSAHIKPGASLEELGNVWAPPSDNNVPGDWAKNVSRTLGLNTAHPFDRIPADQLAKAIQVAEGTTALNVNKGGGSKTSIFAQKIKAKYPQYQDMPDEELTQKILAKYPQYQDMVSGTSESSGGYQTKASFVKQPEIPTEGEQEETIGQKLSGRLGQAGEAMSKSAQGKQGILSGILQTAGAAAGGVGDIISSGLSAVTPDFIEKPVMGAIGGLASKALGTKTGQRVMAGAGEFAQEHPEASANIGAIANIASVLPAGKGFQVAKGAVNKALGKTAIKEIAKDVAPELGGKALIKSAGKGGLIKTALKGEIKPVLGKAVDDVAETVSKSVPNFSKLKTFTDKLNATIEAVYKEADVLKQQVIASGKDILYPFKELNSRLKAIAKPIIIKSDATLSKQFDLVREAALKIAQKNGGKISNLFDARKEFDDLVRQQFPNLYDRANAPMKEAILSIRREMNDFIAEQLPDVNFKESLLNQSRLFDAIDNLAPKAVSEIGTTRASRFVNKFPLTTAAAKGAAKFGLAGLVGGGSVVGANKIFGD